jgi:hypothetical protein
VEALDAILHADDVLAVLGRDVPVRVIDVSSSGCLLQSEVHLVAGTTGSLRVSFDGVEYLDDVRVMRCQAQANGNGFFRVGAEFLWTRQPDERSVRRLIATLQPSALSSIRFGTDRPG